MNLLPAIAVILAGLPVVMGVAYFVALRSGRSGWVDAIWSFAVGIFGAGAALLPSSGEVSSRQWLVAVLALVWSLRLGLHIASRTAASKDDDPRYSRLKQEWGDKHRSRLFWFLQIQAAAAIVLVISIMIAAHNPLPAFGPGDWIGVALFVIAFAGETIADRQLTAFRANPANSGKICDVGLWGVSRHPNYFFEWLGWFAYVPIAIDPGGNYVWGWLAIAGPLLMYWLLVHASGIPPLEAHMLRSRGERFRQYQARVNAFWPGPTKSPASMEGKRP